MNRLLKSLTALAFLPAVLMPLTTAGAFGADLIGLSLPMNKRYEAFSKRFEFGAIMAQGKVDTEGTSIDLKLVDDNCEVDSAPELAKQLNEAKAVIGLPCFKMASELARTFKTAGNPVPFLTARTRNPALKRLRNIENLQIIEFSNAPNAEAQAVVDFILPQFGSKPYAILDDGSVYGRGLADTVRLLAEENGRKPIISANFRPLQTNQRALLRRLKRSGVEAIIIASDPEDVVTIAKDLDALKLDWPIAMGEQIALLPFITDAKKVARPVLAIAPTMRKVLDQDFQTEAANLDVATDPEVVLGHVMFEVAAELIRAPESRNFQTIVGKVSLGDDSRIVLEPFQLIRWNNRQLSTVESN